MLQYGTATPYRMYNMMNGNSKDLRRREKIKCRRVLRHTGLEAEVKAICDTKERNVEDIIPRSTMGTTDDNILS